MKKAIAVIVVVLLLGGGGFFYYYNSHLRYTDAFTECPVAAFRARATSVKNADEFVTEQALGSLQKTEKCSVDCRKGNNMACVLYALAVGKGVFAVKSDKASLEILEKTCKKNESLACELQRRAETLKNEKEEAEAREARKKANEGKLAIIAKEKGEAVKRKSEALDHFKGREGPMTTDAMNRWYTSTIKYLLYDKPALAQMHNIPGVKPKKDLGLNDFVQTKYLSGTGEPDVEMIKAFLDKLRRMGVMQIRLDYYVEKKKESEIPKTHGYFRAKHTFLFNLANAELEIFKRLEEAFS